jgi:hypothetical protein
MVEESKREEVRDVVVRAYSVGAIAEERLETALTEIASAQEAGQLERIGSEMRALLPATAEVRDPAISRDHQQIRISGGNIRKKGPWFRSDRIDIMADHSNILLDFSELVAFPGTTVLVSIELVGCNCTLVFPRGTLIQEEIENERSHIKVRTRGENVYKLRAIVVGKATGTNFKAKTNGRR